MCDLYFCISIIITNPCPLFHQAVMPLQRWVERNKSFRLWTTAKITKEPFIQRLAPQLVLIESKEGHLRKRERERQTESAYECVAGKCLPQNKQTIDEALWWTHTLTESGNTRRRICTNWRMTLYGSVRAENHKNTPKEAHAVTFQRVFFNRRWEESQNNSILAQMANTWGRQIAKHLQKIQTGLPLPPTTRRWKHTPTLAESFNTPTDQLDAAVAIRMIYSGEGREAMRSKWVNRL